MLLVIGASGNLPAADNSEQATINFSEIKEYARFSGAAYLGEAKITGLNPFKDYSITHYGNIPEIEVAYFLATSDIHKTQIIAVRGTSNIENAFVDIALKLVLDKHTKVRLHSGFSQAARQIYAQLKPLLKTDYTISTTGHSLGGAVALILAMYLDVDEFKVGPVITFGQPKVTNISGANEFSHLNITRVVTPKDLVPLVPPFDPVDYNDLDIYWHPGKEVILLADQDYAVTEGLSSMLRATKFTQQPLSESNLQHHQMTLYMSLLDNKIPVARQVPFKNSLNLFNLFGSE